MLIGDKEKFAAEVRGHVGGLRRVSLWAANRLLTRDSDLAFVPQLTSDVRGTLGLLRSDHDLLSPFPDLPPTDVHRRLAAAPFELRDLHRFPKWGPTTDGIEGFHFRAGDRLTITLEFWRDDHPAEKRGKIFVAELPEAEFATVLTRMLDALEGPAQETPPE